MVLECNFQAFIFLQFVIKSDTLSAPGLTINLPDTHTAEGETTSRWSGLPWEVVTGKDLADDLGRSGKDRWEGRGLVRWGGVNSI